ncbi:Hypothetical protein PHPALM_7414 [Phytophthora palmivora]|uniref:FYVE-type domain-containing protein n=1 Tax=Phytophthora palmivora TaxID=4796 RepID=A0A2P4YCR8_9STRA|nr:Hypothetical protein PHPALM_7414 [Phytophthora palmivora]
MELSSQDQEYCRDLTMQLLDRTLYDCDELGLGTTHIGSHADLDCRRFKKLQSHPDVTLYADRNPGSAWLPVMNRGDWEQPVAVVTVGHLNCSLDDLLLAFLTPTVATIRLRGLLMGRRPEKDLELVPIVRSTTESPFQFLGVVRFVNTQHWPLTMFVGPREMVLTLATGEVVTANGRRFGYEIILSVPVCRGSSPMTRTQVLETRIFWEQPDGTVGMYSKLIVDISARLPESVKQGMLCRGVMRFWKFIPRCIETKKLRWSLKYKKVLIRELQKQPQVMGGPASCGGCGAITSKSIDGKPKKRAENRCTLCDVWLCWKSSCRTSCQVTAALSDGCNICEKELALCPRCIVFVQTQNAASIARSETMELTPGDCERCQDLTKQLLEKTLDDCEELGLETTCDGAHANLDKKRWKKIQSHSDVTVYADRNANSAWLPVMRRDDWGYPVAVTAVGRMDVSLEDLLFALVTPNSSAQKLRSFLMERRPEKNCQLAPIVTPTQESPFQFLAVTRFVNTQNWPFTMFKGPREMSLVLASGVVTTKKGRRYGYEMAQSICLRNQGQRNSLPRSRALQARVFWEQHDGSIAVYNKLIIDAKNRLSDSMKQGMLSRAVLNFWKFVPRSLETKKLWWCVKNKKSLIHELRKHHQSECTKESTGCEAKAVKNQSKQTVANQCEFCATWLCGGSKCRISCQLKMVLTSETGFLEQTLTLCPRCAVFVRNRNAIDIARADLVEMEQTSFGSAASFTKLSTAREDDTFSSASTESY